MRSLARGFSLLELMVVVALIGILLALATPSFVTWIGNAQIRGVTDSMQGGLRLAQAEAMRRQRVTVLYRSDTPLCSLAATASTTGNHWLIRVLPGAADEAAQILQCGSSAETGRALTVNGPAAICFGVEGRQQAVASGDTGVGVACTVELAHAINVSSTRGDRPLRVLVASTGRVRLCDPAKVLSATTPDGCPA